MFEAPGVMLACWGFVFLQGILGLERVAGQVAEAPEVREGDLLGVAAAQSLLEDWVLDLKMKMIYKKHLHQAPGNTTN